MTRTQICGASIVLFLMFFIIECRTITNIQKDVVPSCEDSKDVTLMDPFTLGRKYEFFEDSTVNYLMPVFHLKSHEQNYTDFSSRWIWRQAYCTYASRITNDFFITQKASDKWLRGRIVNFENALTTNNIALSYLIEKCKNERVVMINESHVLPNTRILAEIILDSLYKHGFRYFAMEAISENDTIYPNHKNASSTNCH